MPRMRRSKIFLVVPAVFAFIVIVCLMRDQLVPDFATKQQQAGMPIKGKSRGYSVAVLAPSSVSIGRTQSSFTLVASTKMLSNESLITASLITESLTTMRSTPVPNSHSVAFANIQMPKGETAGLYKDICYLTVKSADECKELCTFDIMCFYSFFYPDRTKGNCFTQLFYNSSQPECRPLNETSSIPQYKESGLKVKKFLPGSSLAVANCQKPDFHPFDPSLVSIVHRRNFAEEYKCKTKVTRRFLVEDDQIKLTEPLAKGESCHFRHLYRVDNYTDTNDAVSYSTWYLLNTTFAALTNEFTEVYCEKNEHQTYRDYVSSVPLALAKANSDKAKKRQQKAKKPSRRFEDKMSILMFGVDSTSLSQGFRQLPRTTGYMRQNMDSITLQGYNRVSDNTFPNLYTLMTGKPIVEGVGKSFDRFFDEDPLIFKWFKQDGFVTGYYEDYKMGAVFNWLKKGFHYKPADHFFQPFSVTVEKMVAQNWAGDFCYLDKGMHVWTGDWTKSFVSQYAKLKAPYFQWSWTTMIAHEDSNSLGLGDKYYHQLFKELDKSGVLNNTIVVFYSDHGYRYGGLRATMIGQHEENSPLMTWMIPKWFRHKYAKEMTTFMRNAEHRLVSPYDIHRTLLEFTNGGLESAQASGMETFGTSLFDLINENRTCASAGIPQHFCGCRTAKEISKTDHLTKLAAEAVVKRLNDITSKEGGKCVKYELRHVIKSLLNTRHDLRNDEITELSVTVAMKPSDAEFSATVHISADKNAVVQGISRVSLYGSSANCVKDFEMRLYCTCKGLK